MSRQGTDCAEFSSQGLATFSFSTLLTQIFRIRQTLDVKGEAEGEKFTHKLKKKWQGTHRNSASSMQEKEY